MAINSTLVRTPRLIYILQKDVINLKDDLDEIKEKLGERNDYIRKIQEKVEEILFNTDDATPNEFENTICTLYQNLEINYVTEVHFQCNRIILNADLKQELWHGINIFVTKLEGEDNSKPIIELLPEEGATSIEWNVSGLNAVEYFTGEKRSFLKHNCTKLTGQYCKKCSWLSDPIEFDKVRYSYLFDGMWGFAGESGGNLQIDGTLEIPNDDSYTWVIKSKGGNGSSGEDGFKGIETEDGKPYKTNIDEWLKNVEDRFKKEAIRAETNIIQDQVIDGNTYFKKEIYFDDGKSVTLYRGTKINTNSVAYAVWFQGSDGKLGKEGGRGGKRGKAGYPGVIRGICCQSKQVIKENEVNQNLTCTNGRHYLLNGIPPVPGYDMVLINGKLVSGRTTNLKFIPQIGPPPNNEPSIFFKQITDPDSYREGSLYFTESQRLPIEVENFQINGSITNSFSSSYHLFASANAKANINSKVSENEEQVEQEQENISSQSNEVALTTVIETAHDLENSSNIYKILSNSSRIHLDWSSCKDLKEENDIPISDKDLTFTELSKNLNVFESDENINLIEAALHYLHHRDLLYLLAYYKNLSVSLSFLHLVGMFCHTDEVGQEHQLAKGIELKTIQSILKLHPRRWIKEMFLTNFSRCSKSKILIDNLNISEPDNFLVHLNHKIDFEKPMPSNDELNRIFELLLCILSNNERIWNLYFKRHISEWITFLELDTFCIDFKNNIRNTFGESIINEKQIEVLCYNLLKIKKNFSEDEYEQIFDETLKSFASKSFQDILLGIERLANNEGFIESYLTKNLNENENEIEQDISSELTIEKLMSELSSDSDMSEAMCNYKSFLKIAVDEIYEKIKCTNVNVHEEVSKKLRENLPKKGDREKMNEFCDTLAIIFKVTQNVYFVTKETNKVTCSNINNQDVENKEGLVLRKVQIMAVILFFAFKLREFSYLPKSLTKGIKTRAIFQISTGEGKTLILAVIAIVSVLLGQENVNIITSTTAYAQRDVEKTREIYKKCGVTVSYIREDEQWRPNQFSNFKVLYGNLTSFLKIYLIIRSTDVNLNGFRRSSCILVDEVDNLMLDKANNVLYLAHEIPHLDKLSTIFINIFRMICSNDYSEKAIESYILEQKLNQFSISRLIKLTKITKKVALKIMRHLLENNIIDKHYFFNYSSNECRFSQLNLERIINVREINNDETISTEKIERVINYFRHKEQKILPHYLCKFVKLHIGNWIKNAKLALNLQHKVHYEIDRNSYDAFVKIILIDRDTGSDLINAEWDEGVSIFLQLKHKLPMTNLSLKSVFVSYMSFLLNKLQNENYCDLLGVTGTLGSTYEQTLIEKMQKVTMVKIPPSKSSKMFYVEPHVFNNAVSWLEKIESEVRKIIEKKRAVLVVCETIQSAEKIHQQLYNNLQSRENNIRLYSRTKQLVNVKEMLEDFMPKSVITATNLASRALDIILNKNLEENGGIHLILTYFPTSERVEKQVFGRVARNGKPGSVGFILYDENLNSNETSLDYIIRKKIDRSAFERFKVSQVEVEYVYNIQKQENYFKDFITTLKTNIIYSNRFEKKHIPIIKSAYYEIWTSYLDEMLQTKSNKKTELFDDFLDKLSLLKPNLANWQQWRGPDIANTVQIAKLSKENSENLLNFVCCAEPFFAESAYYALAELFFNKNCETAFKKAMEYLSKTIELLNFRRQTALYNIIDLSSMFNTSGRIYIENIRKPMTQLMIYEDILALITFITGQGITDKKLAVFTKRPNHLIQELQELELLTQWKINSKANITFVSNSLMVKEEYLREIFCYLKETDTISDNCKEFYGKTYLYFIKSIKNKTKRDILVPLENWLANQGVTTNETEVILNKLCEKKILKKVSTSYYDRGTNDFGFNDLALEELNLLHCQKIIENMMFLVNLWDLIFKSKHHTDTSEPHKAYQFLTNEGLSGNNALHGLKILFEKDILNFSPCSKFDPENVFKTNTMNKNTIHKNSVDHCIENCYFTLGTNELNKDIFTSIGLSELVAPTENLVKQLTDQKQKEIMFDLFVDSLIRAGVIEPPKSSLKVKIKKGSIEEKSIGEMTKLLQKLDNNVNDTEEFKEKALLLATFLYHSIGSDSDLTLTSIELPRLLYLDPTELDVLKQNGFVKFYCSNRSKSWDILKTSLRHLTAFIPPLLKLFTGGTYDFYEAACGEFPTLNKPTDNIHEKLTSHIFKHYRTNLAKQKNLTNFYSKTIQLMKILTVDTTRIYFEEVDLEKLNYLSSLEGNILTEKEVRSSIIKDLEDEGIFKNVILTPQTYLENITKVETKHKNDVFKIVEPQIKREGVDLNSYHLGDINQKIFEYFKNCFFLANELKLELDPLVNDYQKNFDSHKYEENSDIKNFSVGQIITSNFYDMMFDFEGFDDVEEDLSENCVLDDVMIMDVLAFYLKYEKKK